MLVRDRRLVKTLETPALPKLFLATQPFIPPSSRAHPEEKVKTPYV
jgi:hypothetical protein